MKLARTFPGREGTIPTPIEERTVLKALYKSVDQHPEKGSRRRRRRVSTHTASAVYERFVRRRGAERENHHPDLFVSWD